MEDSDWAGMGYKAVLLSFGRGSEKTKKGEYTHSPPRNRPSCRSTVHPQRSRSGWHPARESLESVHQRDPFSPQVEKQAQREKSMSEREGSMERTRKKKNDENDGEE